MTISTKVHARLLAGLKKYQSVLNTAKSKDINESDTVMIIADMLGEVFGYDKYSEITSEHVVKKTFCDLAIKIREKVQFLIEVKAIGIDLKETIQDRRWTTAPILEWTGSSLPMASNGVCTKLFLENL